MFLKNGTEYLVTPTSASAIRGLERLKYAFLDECAHIAELDDSEYYGAIVGRLANTDGCSRYVTSAKGALGFFWRRILELRINLEQIRSKKMEISYGEALGMLISQEYVDEA